MQFDPIRRAGARHVSMCLLGVLALASTALHGATLDPEVDLTDLNLKDLMSIEVTSAAKKEQPLHEAAAAIHIVTAEEIRLAGVTTIPGALRLVPGMDVAQLDGNVWAISTRGFNLRFASKMLVLLDGRSVYTPLFSGVFWDVQDTVLDDIERIEVIRGPGATLWGANAVNGVINIITKSAAQTQGGLVEAIGGPEQQRATVRYGTQLGGRGHVRVFGKRVSTDTQASPFGGDANDGSEMTRGGFRMDWSFEDGQQLMVQGDVYDGEVDTTTVTPVVGFPYVSLAPDTSELAGHDVLVRWNRPLADDSSLSAQFYYDHTERDSSQVGDRLDTLDFELQHRISAGRRHDLVWGVGARRTMDTFRNTARTSFDPLRRDDTLLSAFVQDDIRIMDRARLTIGAKVEHNDFTGFEFQPNIRAMWPIGGRHTVWAAVSRAIRSPARGYTDVRLDLFAMPNQSDPAKTDVFTLTGNPDVRSEELHARELGYRTCFRERSCIDVAAFLNVYEELTSLETGAPVIDPGDPDRIEIPQILGNMIEGDTRGVEVSFTHHFRQHVRLAGWYSWFDADLRARPGSTDLTNGGEGASPEHQAMLQLGFDLPAGVRFDLSSYYRDDVVEIGVRGFTRVDSRLSWSPSQDLEASIVFRNMFDESHQEFANDWLSAPSEIERSVHGQLTWHF